MAKVDDSTLEMLESVALAGIARPGSLPVACEPLIVQREITSEDLPLLVQELRERNWASDSPDRMLQTLRSSHHEVARLLASGIRPVEVSVMTGRSLGSISSLQNDPAFQELLAHYAQEQEVREFDAYRRLCTLGGTAMEILQERLEESPDRFTNNELRQLVESTMDRSAAPAKGDPRAAGGQGAGLNVSINFVPARPIVDAEVVEVKQIEEKVS